jgi:putative transposase
LEKEGGGSYAWSFGTIGCLLNPLFEGATTMKEGYQIASHESIGDHRQLARFLAKEGQLLLPMLDLIEQSQCAIDDLVDVMGRATIEAVLTMSAEQVAGPRQQGRRNDQRSIYWHGIQKGRVALKERQLRVDKPRLRKKRPSRDEAGEVDIPAYEAMRKDQRLADRMLAILLNGVSTRKYKDVLPEMADQVGISKSQVSRENIEAGERLLKDLAERDFRDKDILIIYIDGIQFGDYHVIGAVGVDTEGHKHVLGLREGATENAVVVGTLLAELVARGIKPGRRRLFVIDGSKALRKAIDEVYGRRNPVQRCRNHKLRNVQRHLPKDQHDQATATLRAAWKLNQKEGKQKIEQYASWLQRDWPSAAASLREGLDEMFTVNRLNLPGSLRRCLTTTNLIDSTHSGVRQRTRRVTNWKNGSMALRWAAASFVETEKNYRRIMGYRDLWMLKAHLDDQEVATNRKAG